MRKAWRGGVGGADLGRENEGHRFLARLEAAGIAASRSRGSMVRRDGGGEELTTRKGARACAAESDGGDGTDGRTVDEGEAISAVYSGCVGVRSGRGNGENGGVGDTS